MKPFNLEEAKAGKKVVTRDGREYKFGAHNPEALACERIIGWLQTGVTNHYEDGKDWANRSEKDLFMAEEEVWVNVYEKRSGTFVFGAIRFETELDAIVNRDKDDVDMKYLKTIRLKP